MPRKARGGVGPARARSLRVSPGFLEYVLDQLSGLEGVTARSMFGGVGLYHEGLFFGIVARDVLYLKVDEGNRAEYERAGMKAFTPYPDRPAAMRYYEVPVGALESPSELAGWARRAIAAARRAAQR